MRQGGLVLLWLHMLPPAASATGETLPAFLSLLSGLNVKNLP